MKRQQADMFIRVVDEFGSEFDKTFCHLGLSAMYQIATIPEEFREKAFNDDGTTKTVRELQEVKRELKKTEAQRDAERKERERLEVENEGLAGREAEGSIEQARNQAEAERKERIIGVVCLAIPYVCPYIS